MKTLEDYLPMRPGRKTPAKPSERPILSPETTRALENAERLVKEAQKKIIEASYDVDSSPEREKSIGSAREGEAEDEDALYIRDVVSTRFHEANESARIFTRPSARPLAERLCRPEVRRGRARRAGEGATRTRADQSATRRSKSRAVEKNFHAPRPRSPFRPRRADQISNAKTSKTSGSRSPGRVADGTSANSLGVQEGPRVDIRNELTVTDVENIDISPRPRSSLPVRRNTKTYEFRHESRVKDVVADARPTSDEAPSTETGVSGPTRRSPEVAEEPDSLRPAPARPGSRSDLGGRKSGRSIRAEPLEGRADDARTSNREAAERDENPPESFIDFLRRAAKDEAPNLRGAAREAGALRSKVLGSLNTRDQVDIFDRAIDAFFEELERGERPKKNSSRSPARRGGENRLERDVVDGGRVDDEMLEDFAKETLEALDDEPEVLGLDWDPEDIKLEPPNLGDLEKTVQRFDSTIEKIGLGTRNLDVLMSRYCIEAQRPEVAPADRELRLNNRSPFCPTLAKEIPNRAQGRPGHFRRKNVPRSEDYKTPIKEDENLTGSSEESSRGIFTKSDCKSSREAKLGWREQKIPMELAESLLGFSTPLDGSRIIAGSRRANGAKADFGRFFIGSEGPKCVSEKRRIAVNEEPEVSSGARRNEPEENSSRRNCGSDKFQHRGREENSHETSGPSLVQDSAIGGTTDQSEKIFLGTNLIDERVARKDSSRSERSAPARKNYEKSASPSTKTLTVKNRSADVASMAEVGEIESKKLTGEGTKKQRSKGEETSEKNRLAGSTGSSPRDRTSLDVSTVYSEDFEEPVVSSGKSKSEAKISGRVNDGEDSVSEEKKSSEIMHGVGEVEDGKSVPKKIGEKFESTKSDGQSSILKEKKSSAIIISEVEDGRSVPKKIGDKFEWTKSDGQSSILKEKKSSAIIISEVENGRSVLEKTGEKFEWTKSDGPSSILKEKKSSAIIISELEDGRSVLEKTGEKFESTKSDGQSSIFDEKKSSALMDIGDEEVQGVKETGEHSMLKEKKSSEIMADRDREVEDGETLLKIIGQKSESTKRDGKNSIFKDKKSSAMMVDNKKKEVEDGESILITEEKLESTKSDVKNSIVKEKKSSPLMEAEDDKTVRSPRESSEWTRPRGESREETKCPEKSFSVSVNESSDRNKGDDERRLSEGEGSAENNSAKKEADPDSGEVSEKSSGYRVSVLSSSGSIKASGTSSLRESHLECIKAADACSENYSEGELYLPSSCSYSLGEIRISERPSHGTVGTGIESSTRNSEGIRIFFTKSYATLGSSDRTINAPNTAVQSPGEVQETDVESIGSSRGLSSSGEHRQDS